MFLQLVAVEVNHQIYRAVIENMYCDSFCENEEYYFHCWLIDYGTMVEVKKLNKLPSSLRKTPPLALQVCLNNIGYIQQVITLKNIYYSFFQCISNKGDMRNKLYNFTKLLKV